MRLPTRILLPSLLALLAADGLIAAPTSDPRRPVTAASPPIELAPFLVEVSSDLWATPLARLPASVSVYSESDLQASAARHFSDLVDRIPNLTYTGGTSRPRYLQIRGIGENSQFEGETPDSSVRFLIDDLDFTGLGGVAGLMDVERVEVLRGPQAGAFGANAAGGLVRVVTAAPTPVWTGRVEATVGEDALFTLGAALGGPLLSENPEELMVRLAVERTGSDGFRRNVTLNRDTNARDETVGRLRLAWNPAGDWRWETTLLLAEADNGYDEFALDNNGERTFSDRPGRDEQRSRAVAVRGQRAGAGKVRLTTVTTGTWTDSEYSYDDDWTAGSYAGFSDLRRERRVLTQELRLDSDAPGGAGGWAERWTLGGYAGQTDEDGAYTNEDPETRRGLATTYRGRVAAVFAQTGGEVAPHTRLIVGLRAERIDLEGVGTRTRVSLPGGTAAPSRTIAPRFDDAMMGGRIVLERDLRPNLLGFVSATRGYKAGGVNIDARIDPATDPLDYDTETLWSFETGVRGVGAEGKVFGEITLFHLEREDAQVRDSAGFGGSYRFFTDNGGRAWVRGAEASGTWTVTRRLTVQASGSVMDSELRPFVLTNGNAAGGRRLANTPRYGYSLGARFGSGRATGFAAAAELVGRAAQWDSNNQNEARRPFRVVNLSFGYTWAGGWEARVWARNLFDEDYDKRVYFFGNDPDRDYAEARYATRADPRQAGVTLARRF